MAESHSQEPLTRPFADPVLAARLEALKQLADGLTDRVAVMDREYNIIYANDSAWERSGDRPRSSKPAKCYEAFLHMSNPCGTCPATTVFETGKVQAISCASAIDGSACGMRQAFPLMSAQGEVASVLVLFHKGSEKESEPPLSSVSSRGREALRPEQTASGFGDLVGTSHVMRQLFDMIELVADSSATVLLQGESGTGKELVARTIHRTSYRREKPFVVVDCGALPETLLESELFGHVKGAFTGAGSAKTGLFQEADGGTIFLDEIADTSPTFQAKLLRVLQEGEIKRVGGTQPIKIDVRVISATNKDLTDFVKVKSFRQDLYYRLAVLPIYLPPLRDRREDIPLLVSQFIAAACHRNRRDLRRVNAETLCAMKAGAWPGNVRELQHYVERAVITSKEPELICEDLMTMEAGPHDGDLRTLVRGATRETERTRILQALQQASGNKLRAARALNISRATLYNKLRDYGLG